MASESMRKYYAEGIGTFALVFAGCGAAVIDHTRTGLIGNIGIALTFGLIVLAMIYSIGDISGAHINPAVTIAFTLAGRFSWVEARRYILAQCIGAIAGALLLRLLFPERVGIAVTVPWIGVWRSFVLEFLFSWLLMFVVLNVSTGAKEKGITAGIAVGAIIMIEALIGGPLTGASMNPARSIGPALAAWKFSHLWLYIAAPILGTAAAVSTCRLLHVDCCRSPAQEAAAAFRRTWHNETEKQ